MKAQAAWVIVLLLVLLSAFAYVFFLSQPGIKFSCSETSISGFARVPPQMMAVVQPVICKVSFSAAVNGTVLCSGNLEPILNGPIGIKACPKLDNFINQTIDIKFQFFDENGTALISERTSHQPYTGI